MQLFFALTLLTSATLMFWIEPMFAKMVLPLLGGTPMVWNTCMVFYQAVLLGGYVYAHVATKFWGTRRQAKIHLLALGIPAVAVVVATALFVLPIRAGSSWTPPIDSNPIPWLLGFMLVSVGFPLFVVSASARCCRPGSPTPGTSPARTRTFSTPPAILGAWARWWPIRSLSSAT